MINGAVTTQYFKLEFEKGTRQVDSIAAYLLVLTLKNLIILIENNEKGKV